MSVSAYAQRMTPLVLRVRELREALGLTQAALAARAGVRRATVNRIENARVTAIDLVVLGKLADAIGVEPGFIIGRSSGGVLLHPHSPKPSSGGAGRQARINAKPSDRSEAERRTGRKRIQTAKLRRVRL